MSNTILAIKVGSMLSLFSKPATKSIKGVISISSKPSVRVIGTKSNLIGSCFWRADKI